VSPNPVKRFKQTPFIFHFISLSSAPWTASRDPVQDGRAAPACGTILASLTGNDCHFPAERRIFMQPVYRIYLPCGNPVGTTRFECDRPMRTACVCRAALIKIQYELIHRGIDGWI
jgi:hypothetical protein